MSPATQYSSTEPSRSEVDAMVGPTILELGANWCGICRMAQPAIGEALAAHAGRTPLNYLKIEDGRGRPLGRSFGIKLWPTLVVLRDGREVARVVRPSEAKQVTAALVRLDAASAA